VSTYKSWGYDSFLTRTILTTPTQSPAEARNAIPLGALGASAISTPLNATTNITFSSTDNDTAAWTSGTIYFADGSNSGTIDAGNTGDITATTYIYYDREKLGELQTTTNPKNATGMGKILIAIVEKGDTGKDCKVTPTIAAGLVVSGLTADQIKAGTITATELAASYIVVGGAAGDVNAGETTISGGKITANTVTATQISGDQLDAVATNTGTLNVDEYINVGESNVKIDGANKRILINDGTNDRILIGYQLNGF